jgi:hypothetical protein
MIPVDLHVEVFFEKLILETQKEQRKTRSPKRTLKARRTLAKGDYYDCGAAEENPQAVGLCRG